MDDPGRPADAPGGAPSSKNAPAQRREERVVREVFHVGGQELYAAAAILVLVLLGLLQDSLVQCVCRHL
jgi:hypothetical protein